MAYAFKPGESIDAGVKRIAMEELDSAIDQLAGRGEADRGEAIHEARKNVKKTRGLLRLMRPELGAAYGDTNRRLRDAGRKLSEFRDAGAMIEIFDQLTEHYREEWKDRTGLESVRGRLADAKAARELHASGSGLLAQVGEELRALRDLVQDWPLHSDGFAAIAPGLKRTYRDGHHAMRLAIREPSAENYHDWRKRVKDHWYQIRLIGRVCGESLTFYQQNLKQLEGYLGDDHNLTVLRQTIASEGDIEFLLLAAENYQSSLRARAVLIGQDVYDDKPQAFLLQLRKLWQAWDHDRVAASSSFAAAG
jgi:CHAD domain-containing protein